MFGQPSLQAMMLIAVAPILAACAFVNYKETIYTVATWIIVSALDVLVMTGWFAMQHFDIGSDTETKRPVEILSLTDERPTRADYNNIPRVGEGGKVVYSQGVPSVKFDPQKSFFGIILQQYEQGFNLDLTEGYWLDPIKSPSGKKSYRRWQGKNQEFRDLKKQWEGVVFGRENENKNSRFIIRDVEKLRAGAKGQLPH